MSSVGARIRWRNGDILHPAIMWKSPSKRRLPRLLIENRALEVVLLVYVDEQWIVFHETNLSSEEMKTEESTQLEFYLNKFYLLPEKLRRQDAYEWLQKPGNAVLLWGKDNEYFVKSIDKKKFI